MRVLSFITWLLIFCCGCDKEVKDDDVFSNMELTPTEVPADGQSIINVSVKINDAASADRRNFILSTTAGTFTASGNNKYTAKAEYENGVLMARAALRAPLSPGAFIVSVQPEYDSPIGDFVLSKKATAVASVASAIDLETSGFGITSNFASEVFLTALLKNASGKNVSRGVPVLFEDELLNYTPAGGRFRHVQAITADSSKVSAYYAAPAYPIGTTIKLRSTILNSNGQRTDIKDSVLITINL